MKKNNYYFKNIVSGGNLFIIIGFFCIFPLLILSYFNQPSADDFCYYNSGQNLSFIENQVKLFTTVNGRYTTSALLSLPIFLSQNLFLYKLTPILIIVLMFISLYFLFSSLFLNLRRTDYSVLTLFFLSLYIIQMQSIAQGFYWLSSMISYQLSSVFVIIFSVFVIKILYEAKIKHFIIAVFLIILIAGSNEIAMIITNFLLGVVFLFSTFRYRKLNVRLLFLLFIAIALSLFVFKSQGNNLRAMALPNSHMFFYSFLKTLNIIKSYMIIWLPITIIMFLVQIKYLSKQLNLHLSKLFDVPPLFVLFVGLTSIFIGFFAGYWALGTLLPPRAINLIYFFFIFLSIYFSFVLALFFRRKNVVPVSFSTSVSYLLALCLIVLIAKTDNVKMIYSDLLTGKAYNYDLELRNRFKLLRTSKKDIVYVKSLQNKPKTLFVEDINVDSKYWLNGCYCVFFNKDNIVLIDD